MVEGATLEMWYARKGIGGSNPPASAKYKIKIPLWYLYFVLEGGFKQERACLPVGRGRGKAEAFPRDGRY